MKDARQLSRTTGRLAWDLGMGSAVGLLSGAASALFLWLLDRTLALRAAHLWLIAGLPLFGMLSAWLYTRWGGEAEKGGTLVMDEVLEFRGRVSPRMGPLVLLGTLLTHLGGGSAGREGTAVQMGASLARLLGRLPWPWLRLTRSRQRLLLMAGVAGGFGSLFGTPVAGAVFGLEVIAIGKMHYEGLLVCAAASFAGDGLCRLLGVHHAHFAAAAPPLGLGVALKLLAFALPVALVAATFTEGSHRLAALTRARLASPLLRAALGGFAVIALAAAFRTTDFLNLGTVWLPRIFEGTAPVPPWAFAAKVLFTVVTLGFGFKGGEVTPLFVIGALLGSALAPVLGLPIPFLAAVGFVSLFAAASNTPLASLLLGVELFGAPFAGPVLLAAFPAYVLLGHRGIYGGHRVATPKA